MEAMMDDAAAIRDVAERMNELWRTQRYDEMASLLDEDVVIAPPGSAERVRGRSAYIASYREYDRAATTHLFAADLPAVDVIGDVAVAVCPFTVEYELEGIPFRETGRDVLVLRRSDGAWRIAWRTVLTDPGDGGAA